MRKPLDKILCGGKFYRYVVACMHNCPRPHYCNELWQFFEAIGKTPAEYYNEDGIGEKVMRRIVFDCDRCGKRDLLEVYGLYNLEGEEEVCRLDEVQRADMLLQAGHTGEHISRISFIMLDELETSKEWQHYCRACFKDVADGIARMLKPPSNRVRKRKKLTPARIAAKKPPVTVAPDEELAIDTAEPELEVVVVSAAESLPTETTPSESAAPVEETVVAIATPAPKQPGRRREEAADDVVAAKAAPKKAGRPRTKAVSEVPAKAKAKPKAKARPTAKAEAKPTAMAEAKPTARAKAKPTAKAKAKPTAKAKAKPTAKAKAKPAAKAKAKPTAKAKAKPKAKPAAKPKAKAKARPKGKTVVTKSAKVEEQPKKKRGRPRKKPTSGSLKL